MVATIEQEQENIRFLGNLASGISGVMYRGCVPTSITGKFVKHYQYDRFDEVYVELFENGAVFHKIGGGDEWFAKPNQNKAFEKAKIAGARSKSLNSMFGE
jgi:hypothetical protein